MIYEPCFFCDQPTPVEHVGDVAICEECKNSSFDMSQEAMRPAATTTRKTRTS